MATFSLGGGTTPGAPGVYINEQAGAAAAAAVTDFSTVYMLVETEESVPVTRFPFNSPVAITSIDDYKELIRVGTSTVPDTRIPLLSYNCVNEFFQNAQVGDLRVVRVGTPNQIVEVEFLPSGTKLNATDLPSALQAGDKVYVQITLNGLKLVAGDGSTGYTSGGEWLGVPVEIPVNYVAGDEANNRKISDAIVTAVSEAIESNPAVRGSVYVRSAGLVNDLDPTSNSENGFITLAATTYDGNVSVITEVLPVGSNFVLMQNSYDVENIVGGSVSLERVPQDYAQCITTAFDGQQDQGYLITPTAYAQFDAEGRAYVGQIAAEHCASNSYKWMALADPGPFLITDVNKYGEFAPHAAAADLVEGDSYLVDNAIYKWIGTSVSYDRLTHQTIVYGENAQTAINESANLVSADAQAGLLDAGVYTISAPATAANGVFTLSTEASWPVTLPIQKVTLTGAGTGNDFTNVDVQGGATGLNLNGTEVYVVAAPYDLALDSEYSLNNVFLATTAGDASNLYNAVVLAGGTVNIAAPPTGAVFVGAPTGDTATISYSDPYWDLPVDINGQESNLIENTSGSDAGVNTLHLPATLQDPTAEYVLNWTSRTFLDPSAQITSAAGITGVADGSAVFSCLSHNLRSGQIVFFTTPITVTSGTTTTNLISATTKLIARQYYVKVVTADTFVLSNSLANYSTGNYVSLPTGTLSTRPSVVYSQILGRGADDITPVTLTTLPAIRGRKYAFDSNSIWSQALDASVAPSGVVVAGNPNTSIYLNNSSAVLGEDQITPYGEDLSSLTQCDYLPKLNLVAPSATPVSLTTNAYCVPTVGQFFQSEAFFVPSIDAVDVGTYDPLGVGTIGPVATVIVSNPGGGRPPGTYPQQDLTASTGTGEGAKGTVIVGAGGTVTSVTITTQGSGYVVGDILDLPAAYGGAQVNVDTINPAPGAVVSDVPGYGTQSGVLIGDTSAQLLAKQEYLTGTYLTIVGNPGLAPDGQAVVVGDRIGVVYDGSSYSWVVVPADAAGGDLSTIATVCYGSQTEISFSPEEAPAATLWRFDAITSTEIIDNALRGVNFNGEPQAEFIEAGVDNVNRLYDDSQRYGNAQGFIAYYGPYIENGAGQFIPPSSYVTGVAVRRYRSEGYQFPPAGVKYQLTDAVGVQIPINSAQQNRLNPGGCNAVRTLPGYPTTSVYIWGGRTRLPNPDDAQQKLYQFVNTRVILNVVYGSLRNAFDTQIFNVIDGFGVVFNQIISVGNSVLNQLYIRGALFGAKPSEAFQVLCDNRINTSEDLENGVVNAKVFVTPVPTLERIQIDLIRVAIGKMNEELDIRGLGANNQ